MELSEQTQPVLFSQMSQMFPNVPKNVIELFTVQYSHDAELCAHMLGSQNSVYTTPIDKSSLQIKLNNLKLDFHQDGADKQSEDEANQNVHSENCIGDIDICISNDNILDHRRAGTLICKPSELHLEDKNCNGLNLNNDGSQILSPIEITSSEIKEPFHELHIDIEPDEDGIHSWRPNASSNISTENFFIPHQLSALDPNLSYGSYWLQNYSNGLDSMEDRKLSFHQSDEEENHSKIGNAPVPEAQFDSQRYMDYQKAHMNITKYEVTKTKMELNKLKEEIERLSLKLKATPLLNEEEMKRLNDENSELRLECQCLCIEVDHYVKGKAPLGEVNEEFYKQSSTLSTSQTDFPKQVENPSAILQKQPNSEENASNKWECSQCTFANHPQIKICEMCQTPQRSRNAFKSTTHGSCFCHPLTGHPSQ